MTGNGKGNLKSDDMDFLELAKKRFSARSYRPDKVEKEKTDYILECVRVAPSAVNRQPWRFLVIESDEKRRLVQECYSRDWLKEAPLYIVVCAEYPAAWTRKYDGKNHGDIDASIAVEHICLAAADVGLGSCWVCNFNVAKLSSSLCLPQGTAPVAIVPIGYAASGPEQPSARKPLDEIVEYL